MDKPVVSRTILSPNSSSRNGIDIDHIVLHYTTSRNIEGTIKHFMTGTPKVSAHYVIAQNGELVQMVSDDRSAWHATSMNPRSIGIEHCAKVGDKITPSQERTSALLIRWLVTTYNIPHTNIIPHVAVKPTSCPGDLFGAYGGKTGGSKELQQTAITKWLNERVFVNELPELSEEPEVAMSDDNVVIDGPVVASPPAKKPASQSLTVWGALWGFAVTVGPAVSTYFGVPMTPELISAVGGLLAGTQAILGRKGAAQPIKLW